MIISGNPMEKSFRNYTSSASARGWQSARGLEHIFFWITRGASGLSRCPRPHHSLLLTPVCSTLSPCSLATESMWLCYPCYTISVTKVSALLPTASMESQPALQMSRTFLLSPSHQAPLRSKPETHQSVPGVFHKLRRNQTCMLPRRHAFLLAFRYRE